MAGVQRFAAEICLQLKAQLKDVVFVAPPDLKHTALAKKLGAVSVGRNQGHLWEQVDLLWHLLKQGSPYLLSLTNTAPILYHKNFTTIHDLIYLRFPQWHSKKYYYFHKLSDRILAATSQHMFTVSNFSKREISNLLHMKLKKITVVSNAVSSQLIAPPTAQKVTAYGKYILSVSSFDPRKNINRLIRAYQNLPAKDVSLVLVGRQVMPYFTLDSNVDKTDKIHFVKDVSDETLARLYANAELFVYPSLYEGFGIPPLEAMANGCPVVASNTTSLPEILGDGAYYIDPTESNNITNAIATVLYNRDVRLPLTEKGKLKAKEYSWQRSASTIVSTIQSML